MPKFTVYEVQDVSETRRYRYTVEATSAEHAAELVTCGEGGEPEDLGRVGDLDYGPTGHFAFPSEPADQPEPIDAWGLAMDNLRENF